MADFGPPLALLMGEVVRHPVAASPTRMAGLIACAGDVAAPISGMTETGNRFHFAYFNFTGDGHARNQLGPAMKNSAGQGADAAGHEL